MSKTTKTFTYIIGIVMTVAMVGSLILPMLSGNIGQANIDEQAARPTPFPEPTLPPPPDITMIGFDDRYLHPSGLLTFGSPTGWLPSTDSSTAQELRAGLNNADALSVVEVRVNKNDAGLSDADALSAYFDRTWLGQTWSGYSGWDETGRAVNAAGRLRIDFNLRRGRSHLIARQLSWLAGAEIYSVRVITAENAAQELRYVLQGVAEAVELLPAYADAPFDRDAYFDNFDKHMLRYPMGWELTDAAAGGPATIVGAGAMLTVGAFDALPANEDEAAAWLENWRSGVETLSVNALELGGAAGFKASYRLSTLDGAVESGVAVMLGGADNRLHVANLRLADLDADLLAIDPADEPRIAVLDSFRLLPDLEVDVTPDA